MDSNREALWTRVHKLSCFGRAGENDGEFQSPVLQKKKKKKIADVLTNLLDLQNSSDHTQPQQIITNYTLCLQVAQDYNIMNLSILR